MSQLSFADFFDLAKSATPIRTGIPVLKAPSPTRGLLSIDVARRQFISVFRDTARNLRRWDVFRDFITLAASELDIARFRTPENAERRRKICERYDAADIANMHELFWLMICALEAKFHDFLGAIFMELELGDDRNGQHFTPYHVQSLLAKLVMPDVQKTISREGFVTVSDPASGSAGMIIACAENLLQAGFNPSEAMFGSCIDIDPVAADMAFIQLSLLGIPAEVITGNTLTMQFNRVRYTPVYYFNSFEKKLADQRRLKTMMQIMRDMRVAA